MLVHNMKICNYVTYPLNPLSRKGDLPTLRSKVQRYYNILGYGRYIAKVLKPPSTTATVPVTNFDASLIR